MRGPQAICCLIYLSVSSKQQIRPGAQAGRDVGGPQAVYCLIYPSVSSKQQIRPGGQAGRHVGDPQAVYCPIYPLSRPNSKFVQAPKLDVTWVTHKLYTVLYTPLSRPNSKFAQAPKLDVTWVAHKLLPELGLPQYSHVFERNLVDGRILNSLCRRDLEKHFDIHRKFHQASILHAVELLRRMEFDREVSEKKKSRTKLTADVLEKKIQTRKKLKKKKKKECLFYFFFNQTVQNGGSPFSAKQTYRQYSYNHVVGNEKVKMSNLDRLVKKQP